MPSSRWRMPHDWVRHRKSSFRRHPSPRVSDALAVLPSRSTSASIVQGSFAALRTDMYKDWGNPERFKRYPFPAWSLAAVQFLFEKRKITAIGHESLDTDITSTLDAEKWVLGQGRYQIEVMAHLDKVPPTGALIVVTWPKVANGLGFPARAFAIVP